MSRADYVTVAKVMSAHGVRGEFKLLLLTDFPERIRKLKKVYLIQGEEVRGPYTVASARLAADKAILRLQEISSREEAAALKGWEVAVVKSEAVKLPPGHYYHFQLIGLPVYTEEGEYLGKVSRVIDLPSNDVYVVTDASGEEVLLPATREIVQEINLEKQCMRVKLLPGLR
ncbi:MAG: 16S rRNA processing protein RimM [Firmicutes bacterium]|jgi:16S rRNA processing protein RimM|nr:16S rRNA processing protein RimM [Bacillota bacterium]